MQAIKTTPKEWLVTYVLQKGKGYKEQQSWKLDQSRLEPYGKFIVAPKDCTQKIIIEQTPKTKGLIKSSL